MCVHKHIKIACREELIFFSQAIDFFPEICYTVYVWANARKSEHGSGKIWNGVD